jgi:hypothetical protein
VIKHPLTPALAVGLPLAAAYAVLANTVDLGQTVTLVLFLLVLLVPILIALELDARRRGVKTRISRLSHHEPAPPRQVDA